MRVPSFRFGCTYIVPNLRFREIVTRNGIPFTYIRSAHKVNDQYRSLMPGGSGLKVPRTAGVLLQVIFPFSDPMSGPNISSAARMSSRVIGQFGSLFLATIRRKSLVLGHPILICSCRAVTARERIVIVGVPRSFTCYSINQDGTTALVRGQVIVVQSALRLFELVDSSIWLGDHEYVLVAVE
jgi:hypothetical protein